MDAVQVVSVACNHCGGPLDVPPGIRFVTCTYCHSRLEIHRTGNAAYTEVLEAIRQDTTQIAGDIGAIKIENEVERLDREWLLERENFMVRREDGRSSDAPSAVGSVIGAAVMAVFGVAWLSFLPAEAPFFFRLVGFAFIVLAVVGAVMGVNGAGRYAEAERHYRQRRNQLLTRLPPDEGK